MVLENYKSIAYCDVKLGPLTFLVGPNASGKSNFLDALEFVSGAMSSKSFGQLFDDRSGFDSVIRQASPRTETLGIRIDFRLSEDFAGFYSIRFRRDSGENRPPYAVDREECHVTASGQTDFFVVRDGRVQSSVDYPPPVNDDRAYLAAIAGRAPFGPVLAWLIGFGFADPQTETMKKPSPKIVGRRLEKDANNIAAALVTLRGKSPEMMARIQGFLSALVPSVGEVEITEAGSYRVLEFVPRELPWPKNGAFSAGNMSDGTLRALGVLVSLFESVENSKQWPLLCIEEPERSLHPAGTAVLLDALKEASESIQILATTHSGDLLDTKEIPSDSILAFQEEHGISQIGPVDVAARSVLKRHLYTPGELLRMDELKPPSTPAKSSDEVGSILFTDVA